MQVLPSIKCGITEQDLLMHDEVTIYALVDPNTLETRYVGKANNIKVRIRGHKWESKSSKLHTRKVNWLKSLGDKEPMVVVLEISDRDNWQEAEKRWIAELRKTNKNLTNFADGGQTSPVEGKGHTEETKAKLKALALARGCKPPSRKGQVVSDITREKLRKASLLRGATPPPMGGWNKGKKMTKEFCEQMSEARKGMPWSPARRKAQENKLTTIGE